MTASGTQVQVSELLPARPETLDGVLDPGQAVVRYLEQATLWLAQATELDDVCEAKSRSSAIEVYVTQKALGKDAELAAAELVRRAERRIDQLVKEGQARGEIATRGRPPKNSSRGKSFSDRSPTEFLRPSGRQNHELRLLGSGSTDEVFEVAVAEAKAERNLSRRNVARKIKDRQVAAPGQSSDGGRSSWHHRTRHVDPNRVVREMAITLDGLVSTIALVDSGAVSPETVGEWAPSMKRSLLALNRFTKELRTHE
jgi:hypothetical protein